ncbi:MAG: hypothetical protein AAFO94_20125, partial [Bacteroidota bacterium]
KKFPYTTIKLFAPSLNITPVPSFSTCADGGAQKQKLIISNNGTGPANELAIQIKPKKSNQHTRTEENSIAYTIDGSSATTIVPVATQATTNASCLGAEPIDGFTVVLPVIGPGQTMELSWDNYTCASDNCGSINYVGWEYESDYTDMCNSKNYSSDGEGQERYRKNLSTFYESPSDLADGQKGTYVLNINSATFDLPDGTNPYFEAVFNIPNGLEWSGNAADLRWISSQTTWTADAVNYDSGTRTLTARYNTPLPNGFALNHAQFNLDLTADCAAGVSSVTLGMQLFYILDNSCSNPHRITLTCKEQPQTFLHCPGPCDHGMQFEGFNFARTSFGTSDNDLDGLPDATNALDLTKVRTNRVMVSDTFETTFTGTIQTSATYPTWSYAYAKSEIPGGNNISILSARVEVL